MKNKIDVVNLSKLLRQAQSNIEKTNTRDEKRKEINSRRMVNACVRKWIDELPAALKKVAKQGENSVTFKKRCDYVNEAKEICRRFKDYCDKIENLCADFRLEKVDFSSRDPVSWDAVVEVSFFPYD